MAECCSGHLTCHFDDTLCFPDHYEHGMSTDILDQMLVEGSIFVDAIEHAGLLLRHLQKLSGDELKALSLKPRDYVTGQVTLDTVGLYDY